ncbi:hypothetical protein D3C86_1754580 [compost metagenome]
MSKIRAHKERQDYTGPSLEPDEQDQARKVHRRPDASDFRAHLTSCLFSREESCDKKENQVLGSRAKKRCVAVYRSGRMYVRVRS